MTKKTIISRFFLFLSCYFLLSACFEPEEGCLDIEANNFQLAADRDCSKDASTSCFCTYPSVSLDLMYVFNDSTFTTDQAYQIGSGEYIKIRDIQFYISDIQLLLEDNQIVHTLDTITLAIRENGTFERQLVLDDFYLIPPPTNQTNLDLITTNRSGTFTQLQFRVGIKPLANTTQPDEVSNTAHVLAIDSLYLEGQGYVFNRLLIQPDTNTTETILVQLTEADSLPKITLNDNMLAIKEQGKDISLGTLQINHARWFDGINFAENSKDEIHRKIALNTINVFTLLP